jgi:FkbM family methyltransferase
MKIGRRDLKQLSFILRNFENYQAVARMFIAYPDPIRNILEQFGFLKFNFEKEVKTPIGNRLIYLNHIDDIDTVHGVFARHDYSFLKSDKIILDIGANIGLATLFALTRSYTTKVWAFEPVPKNIALFKQNCLTDCSRVKLFECAVHDYTGNVSFKTEPVGKYGGINPHSETSDVIDVSCIDINSIIESACTLFGHIDAIKLDTEGTELHLLNSIDLKILV